MITRWRRRRALKRLLAAHLQDICSEPIAVWTVDDLIRGVSDVD